MRDGQFRLARGRLAGLGQTCEEALSPHVDRQGGLLGTLGVREERATLLLHLGAVAKRPRPVADEVVVSGDRRRDGSGLSLAGCRRHGEVGESSAGHVEPIRGAGVQFLGSSAGVELAAQRRGPVVHGDGTGSARQGLFAIL